jgi:hypothetical protein
MFSKVEIIQFAKTYGTLILSIYGVLQVWAIALWKKFFRVGKITIFETSVIEIGLSNFGPTVSLNGTLQALRKDVFVREIGLSLTSETNSGETLLEWTALRSPQIKIGDPMATTVELPSGVNVRTDQPLRYQIVFSKRRILIQINQQLNLVVNEWKQNVTSKQNRIGKLKASGVADETITEQIFSEFLASSASVKSFLEQHSAVNWWRPGRYRMRMIVKTASPDRTFPKVWDFVLDEAACQGLRGNSEATLRELCLGTVQYFFAYPEYLPVN